MLTDRTVDLWFTMGPQSRNPLAVQRLIEAGATGVRLGFAFGTQELQTQRAHLIHNAAVAADESCTVIADLPGEKIRLGDFSGHDTYSVEADDSISLVPLERGFDAVEAELPVDPALFERVNVDDTLIIGDGSVAMRIETVTPDHLDCKVERGGVINPNRGVIVQGAVFEPRTLTEDDATHLEYIAESDLFDGVALSFVSTRNDVVEARNILASSDLPIISKIETRDGVENATAICEASDAVMIARGDLALYRPWAEVGLHTERIVNRADATDTPWMLATQVVEGLEQFSFPTRAEVCDLTRWLSDGADGILLSHETAFGSSPVDAIARVNEVIEVVLENGRIPE